MMSIEIEWNEWNLYFNVDEIMIITKNNIGVRLMYAFYGFPSVSHSECIGVCMHYNALHICNYTALAYVAQG